MTTSSGIKYLLFDLDGTLCDPKEGIIDSFRFALSHFNIKLGPTSECLFLIGPPLYDSLTQRFGLTAEQARIAMDHYGDYFLRKGVFEYQAYSGIENTLAELKKSGFQLAVVTSKTPDRAEAVLKYLALAQYFEWVIGSVTSPKSETILECMQKFGDGERQKYIMIGDREHDILGAKKVGISSIGVLYGYGSKKELEQAGADHIIDHHEELPQLLSKEQS